MTVNDFIKSTIEKYAKKYKSPILYIPTVSYEIPLNKNEAGE